MSEELNFETPTSEPELLEDQPKRRSPIRRAGCIIGLLVWFLILLLPCFLIVLATQQEITITTGGAPGQQTRLWLISEAEQRGLALSTGTVQQSADNAICVQTSVNYYLWTGTSEPSMYCECYERENADAEWSFMTSTQGACTG